jgi:ATP-grasp domain, R2K clade family 3
MDVAQRRDGEWIIVELGDGRVAGLPGAVAIHAFYSSLGHRIR